MSTWYLLETTAAGPAATGPFTLAELAPMVASRRLTPETRVARAGTSAWIRAADEPDLVPLFGGAGAAHAAASGVVGLPTTLPPYSISAAFTIGWSAFKSNWAFLVLVALILIGLSVVLQIPGQIGQMFLIGSQQNGGVESGALMAIGSGLACVGALAGILVGIPLQAGFGYAGVRAVRGELQVTDIFAGFKRYGAVLGTGLLLAVVATAIFVVCAIPLGIGIAIAAGVQEPWPAILGGLVTIPVAIAVAVFLAVFLTIPLTLVVDPRMKAKGGPGALSIAWQLGKGPSPSFFLLALCAGLICAMSFCGCGIGIILFGLPFYAATMGAAYELITAPFIAKGQDPRRWS